jgi:hypothetical protein
VPEIIQELDGVPKEEGILSTSCTLIDGRITGISLYIRGYVL